MNLINKQFLRIAFSIHTQLTGNSKQEPQLELPTETFANCVELVRKIRRTRLRGWRLATESLSRELRHSVSNMESELARIRERAESVSPPLPVAAVSDLYRDISALEEEFEKLEFELSSRWLSVTTEPIELEGVYLGPFAIRLEWGHARSDERPQYRVVAKDPHPARSRENVTHPHVSDEVLCEGGGRHAIRQALAQGRLYDFFTLIAAVLRNYNNESPYVELALWSGESCTDCGEVVNENDNYCCQKCGDSICGECAFSCGACSESYCSCCIGSCGICEDRYCHSCLKLCEDCQRPVCDDCLNSDERCAKCHEEDPIEERTDDGVPASSSLTV